MCCFSTQLEQLFVTQICCSGCAEHHGLLEEIDYISCLESKKSFICPTPQNLSLLVTSLRWLIAHSTTESLAAEHWEVHLCVRSSLVCGEVQRETGNTWLE